MHGCALKLFHTIKFRLFLLSLSFLSVVWCYCDVSSFITIPVKKEHPIHIFDKFYYKFHERLCWKETDTYCLEQRLNVSTV